jgi:hypothetical protein
MCPCSEGCITASVVTLPSLLCVTLVFLLQGYLFLSETSGHYSGLSHFKILNLIISANILNANQVIFTSSESWDVDTSSGRATIQPFCITNPA